MSDDANAAFIIVNRICRQRIISNNFHYLGHTLYTHVRYYLRPPGARQIRYDEHEFSQQAFILQNRNSFFSTLWPPYGSIFTKTMDQHYWHSVASHTVKDFLSLY